MKKLIALTALLAFIVGTSVCVLANDDESTNASNFCKANEDLGYINHGQCVSVLMAPDGPVKTCKQLLNDDPEEFYDEYNNLGECISHTQDGYVSE